MTRAVLREIDGQLVLDDPAALDLIAAVQQVACRAFLDANAERVRHFKNRIRELGRTAADTIILVLDGDDPIGALIADACMPEGWAEPMRANGDMPIARGLAVRDGIQEMLDTCKPEAGADLRAVAGVACIVVHGDVLMVGDLGPL